MEYRLLGALEARRNGVALTLGGVRQRTVLAALALRADQCARVLAALGDRGGAVAVLRDLVTWHPLREDLWVRLMLALARAGRPAEALDAYQEVRGALVEELGVEPGGELRRVQAALLA